MLDDLTNLCICTNLSLKDHSGGVDRIVNLAKSVSRNGVNVYLIDRSVRRSLSNLFLNNDKYYQIRNGVFEERPYPARIRFLFPGLIRLNQEILNRLTSVLTFSALSEVCLSYVIDPYQFIKLLYVCSKERIDIIQSELPITVPSSALVKKLLNIPLIYDAHNMETERVRSAANVSKVYAATIRLIERIGCISCDTIFAVSEKDRELFVSSGISCQKITVIPNSVETNTFPTSPNVNKIKSQYKLKDKIVMIFHGSLRYPPNEEACKILANVILPSILERHPDVYLFLVGSDPPRISHPNVIVTGFVKNLHDYIAAADIAVVPLLRGGGTRIKILEYMACGKPVVSTIKGSEGLNLQNGSDILIARYPDSNFTDLVNMLIEDRSLRQDIGANARRKVISLYAWKKTAKKAVQCYDEIFRAYEKNRKKYSTRKQGHI